MLAPGATIGILGGGQLGRMTALAAARLGYRAHIFATEPDSPAAQVAAGATVASWDDNAAIEQFADAVDVATFEFENIPGAAVRRVSELKPVMPRPEILEITQDRLREKDFLRGNGVATTDYQEIADALALGRTLAALKGRAVLKSARMGYDGKGQVTVESGTPPDEAWRSMGASRGILESFVDFRCEVSVIVARGADGAIATYPPVENRHVNHILDTTIAPASLPPETGASGRDDRPRHRRAARPGRRARGRDVRDPRRQGCWSTSWRRGRTIPGIGRSTPARPASSSNWCARSAACRSGSTERHADAVMKNLIGDEVETWRDAIADPTARLHLYGKREVFPGRKMGHVTRLVPRS
jgi:5-(carboxyamino)imidazole ribonucleotide synthase